MLLRFDAPCNFFLLQVGKIPTSNTTAVAAVVVYTGNQQFCDVLTSMD